jgi:hypothetical protein
MVRPWEKGDVMRVGYVVAALVAVLGANVATLLTAAEGDPVRAPTVVPADAVAYVHVTLDPSLNQKRALLNLMESLPEGPRKKLSDGVPRALDEMFAEVDVDFSKDIKPWLGTEIALFVSGAMRKPDGAVLLETTDAEASLRVARRIVGEQSGGTPQEATHRETPYWTLDAPRGPLAGEDIAGGVVEDFLVLGTPDGVTSVIDAAADGGLDTSESYSRLVGGLPEDRLVTYWVDAPALLQEGMRDIPPAQARLFRSSPFFSRQQELAGSIAAASDAIVFDTVSTKPEAEDALPEVPANPELMASLPDGTWVGYIVPGLGVTLESLLDAVPDSQQVEKEFAAESGLDLRDDVLAWMGDAALFATGGSVQHLSGGLVIESDDAAATGRVIDAIRDAGVRQGGKARPVTAGDLSGFAVADKRLPARVTVLGGDRLVLAVDAAKVAPADSVVADLTGQGATLAGGETFTRATESLGAGYAPVFFLDINGVISVVESIFSGSDAPSEVDEAKPYAEELSHLIAGVREDGDLVLQRLVVGASPP